MMQAFYQSFLSCSPRPNLGNAGPPLRDAVDDGGLLGRVRSCAR